MGIIGVITSVELQKRNKTRVSIHVDGQYLGSVEDIVWAKSGLKTGHPLPEELWQDMQGRQEEAAALEKAVTRLASRARSKAEMEKYLAEKGFSESAISYAIEKLEGYGYIDDGEFARLLVRDRVNTKSIGKRSLAQELKRLGVGEEDAGQALSQYAQEDELAAALRQAEKDMRRTAAEMDIRKRRAKVYNGLARRGFSGDVIEAAMAKVFSGSSEQ